ncbi:hypothetical protein OJ253_2385 [Cryptosporidium canis]|uniref:Uncharacterized protein n=1 Tax=Cryptosporidium canis TaxID=195482 RepID=A0A9D5DI99_9CRYT|nr:hypothetical protein OJ253_2385 [Cryptosporidium canis]
MIDSECKSILEISLEERRLHLNKIYKAIGEILIRAKELTDIDNAAEIFDYSRRIEFEMDNFEKISNINSKHKLVKNILIKEISCIEHDVETLKLEFCRISNQLLNLYKERDHLEKDVNKLNMRYETIKSELNEIKHNLNERSEEFRKYSKANDSIKRELEDLELAITLEENMIAEKKNELQNLEISNIKKKSEKRKLDKLASQATVDLKRKIKVREIIEERISETSYPIQMKTRHIGDESEEANKTL